MISQETSPKFNFDTYGSHGPRQIIPAVLPHFHNLPQIAQKGYILTDQQSQNMMPSFIIRGQGVIFQSWPLPFFIRGQPKLKDFYWISIIQMSFWATNMKFFFSFVMGHWLKGKVESKFDSSGIGHQKAISLIFNKSYINLFQESVMVEEKCIV